MSRIGSLKRLMKKLQRDLSRKKEKIQTIHINKDKRDITAGALAIGKDNMST